MGKKKTIGNQGVASDIAIESIGQSVGDVRGVKMLSKSTCGGSGWAKGQPVYWDDKHERATAIKGKGFKCIGEGFADTDDSKYEARVKINDQTQRS